MAKNRQQEIVLARMIDMQNRLETFDDAVLIKLKKQYKIASERLLEDVKKAKSRSARIWTNTRLTALLEETQITHQAIVGVLTGQAADAMVEVGAYSYKTMNNIVGWDGKVLGYNNVSLSPQQMKGLVTTQKLAGKNLEEWMGEALSVDIDSIKGEVAQGLIRGEGYNKMVSRLREELQIPRGSKQERDLETVVKTYTQAVNGKAQQDVYNANDIVNKLEWSAIMETGNVKTGRGTCPRCIALDGQEWAKDDLDRPPMPLHPRCRCMFVPVTKSWKDLGFNIDEMEKEYQPWTVRDDAGKIVEHGFEKDYADWFKTRGKEFQDKAIGPKRAELYREGKIQLKDLVDSKGNLRLLDELTGKVVREVIEEVVEKVVVASALPSIVSTSKPAPDINYPDDVYRMVPKKQREQFKKVYNDMHPDIKKVVASFRPPRRFISDSGPGSYQSVTKTLKASPTKRKGATARHELGHYIDDMMGGKQAYGNYHSWIDRDFIGAIADDKNRLGLATGDKALIRNKLRAINKELRAAASKDTTAGIQDIIDGMVEGDFRLMFDTYGHSKEYWRSKRTKLNSEAFANMFEMYSDPKAWAEVEKHLPNTAFRFKKIIQNYILDNDL